MTLKCQGINYAAPTTARPGPPLKRCVPRLPPFRKGIATYWHEALAAFHMMAHYIGLKEL
jgi:hypothetical protein